MTIPRVRYERRKLAELVPDKANPRKPTDESRAVLSASVTKFGLVQAIVVNERTGRIVGGHERRQVLIDSGETEADVAIGSWTEAEERALNVVLNDAAGQGKFTDGVGDYLSEALPGLSLSDLQELRLDEFVRPEATRPIAAIETGPVLDEFWISVRGPLAGQAAAIDALKVALGKVAGVTVEIGVIER